MSVKLCDFSLVCWRSAQLLALQSGRSAKAILFADLEGNWGTWKRLLAHLVAQSKDKNNTHTSPTVVLIPVCALYVYEPIGQGTLHPRSHAHVCNVSEDAMICSAFLYLQC